MSEYYRTVGQRVSCPASGHKGTELFVTSISKLSSRPRQQERHKCEQLLCTCFLFTFSPTWINETRSRVNDENTWRQIFVLCFHFPIAHTNLVPGGLVSFEATRLGIIEKRSRKPSSSRFVSCRQKGQECYGKGATNSNSPRYQIRTERYKNSFMIRCLFKFV